MNEVIDTVLTQLREHGLKLLAAAVFGFIGWYFGLWRARRKWQRREFLDRLNVSLNIVQDGKLQIRTLMEKSAADVFLNSAAIETVLAAAKQTTATNPILPLPAADYWYYLNAVLNEISEQFAEGHLKRDMGLPVQRALYLLGLTYETSGEIRTRKIRAMIIRKDVLQTLPPTQAGLEKPHHSTRWQTLQQMKAIYEQSPHQFIEVEICL